MFNLSYQFVWPYVGEEDEGEKKPDPKPKSFSQTEVNSILAKEKKKDAAKMEGMETKLQSLSESQNLSADEKADLETQLESLKDEKLTTEQKLVKDHEKTVKKHGEDLTAANTETEVWKNRFVDSQISTSIVSAAASESAYNPAQIQAMVSPNTSLLEGTDEEGKPNGIFTPSVTMELPTPDEEGKFSMQTVPVVEALKGMKEMTDQYGNLFNSGKKSGAGGTHEGGQQSALDLKDAGNYRQQRKNLGLGRKQTLGN